MNADRAPKTFIIVSVFVAFALGAIVGAFAARNPRRYLPQPRVALAPGIDRGSATTATLPSRPSLSLVREGPDSVPGDGTALAPDGYPVKGNGRSGIYHVPGGFAYGRTVASIHFRTAGAAEAAGFRASKS